MFGRRILESEIAELEMVNKHTPLFSAISEKETISIPYRWICQIRVVFDDLRPRDRSSYSLGTGVLIGPRQVLTAGHNLAFRDASGRWHPDKIPFRIAVQPALNGDFKLFNKPFEIRGWIRHPYAFKKMGKKWTLIRKYDYALITLKEDISTKKPELLGDCNFSYWGDSKNDIKCGGKSVVGVDATTIRNQQSYNAGYHDKSDTLWSDYGDISLNLQQDLIYHRINTLGGHSGSPIWFRLDGVPYLVGIHSGAGTLDGDSGKYVNNHAVLITPEIIELIEKKWKPIHGW